LTYYVTITVQALTVVDATMLMFQAFHRVIGMAMVMTEFHVTGMLVRSLLVLVTFIVAVTVVNSVTMFFIATAISIWTVITTLIESLIIIGPNMLLID